MVGKTIQLNGNNKRALIRRASYNENVHGPCCFDLQNVL